MDCFKMTLRGKYKTFPFFKYYYYAIVIFIFILACLGLIIFAIPGIVKDDFNTIYFFIGTAITLAGFTMLSGIFEGTGTKTKIERKLFLLSILFLVSAFSFILFMGLYSGLKGVDTNSPGGHFLSYITIGTYLLGVLLFFMGFAILIIALIQYYKQIDAGQNAWWQFWK